MSSKLSDAVMTVGTTVGPEIAKAATPYVMSAASSAVSTVGAVAVAAAPIVLTGAAVVGAGYAVKKLWDWMND